MAVVLDLAAARQDRVVHGLAGDLLVAFKLAQGEVPGRQAAGLVDDIDEDVGAVLAEGLADRMIDEGLGEDPVRLLEFFRIGDRHLAVLRIDGDEFDLLRAHDRAKTATAAGAQAAVRVLAGDVGGGHPHLTGRADGDHAQFAGQTVVEGLDDREVAFADQLLFFVDGDALRGDHQAVPGIALGLAFEDQGLAAAAGEKLGRCAAGIGLLDGAGQRTLAADRDTAGVGGDGAGEQAGGEDQFVFRPEGVAGRFDLRRHDGGCQAAAAVSGPGSGDLFHRGGEVGHIHAKNFVRHGILLVVFF